MLLVLAFSGSPFGTGFTCQCAASNPGVQPLTSPAFFPEGGSSGSAGGLFA